MDGPEMLTVADIAERLNVSNMTVYRRIQSGELKAYRFGRAFRVYEADLNAYMKYAAVTLDSISAEE